MQIQLFGFQGIHNGWTRDECDKAFHRDMQSLCHIRHNNKRFSLWKKLKAAASLAGNGIKWLGTEPGTLEHCLVVGDIFYEGVDGFGQEHYGTVKQADPDSCSRMCVWELGDPWTSDLSDYIH